MTGIHAFIIGSAIAIGIVVYSALVVSSKQEQRMIQRKTFENRFPVQRASSFSDAFSFETSEELEPEDEPENKPPK